MSKAGGEVAHWALPTMCLQVVYDPLGLTVGIQGSLHPVLLSTA